MAYALSCSPSAPRCCSLGFRVSDRRPYSYCGVGIGRTGLPSYGERRTSMLLSIGISSGKQLPSFSSSLVLLLSPRYQLEFQQQYSFLGSRRSNSSCFTTSARRSSRHSSTSSTTSSPKKKDKVQVQRNDEEEVDIDEDAFEALFAQLEEDLKNDNSFSNGSDDDDDITEEDLANLEKELEEALGDVDFEELSSPTSSLPEDIDSDEEPEEVRPKLKNWQLRRLAAALKIGRRKTNIKSLAAELGLDRAFVLELLREPPPNLLLLSASLPDNVVQQPAQIESKLVDPITPVVEATKTDPEVKAPIHVMRTRWVEQKRLKKSQVHVLEKVYYRTKRPTNAMISSIVDVTNLPWKKIVKWFEDKRLEDGIPEKRQPFHRHA